MSFTWKEYHVVKELHLEHRLEHLNRDEYDHQPDHTLQGTRRLTRSLRNDHWEDIDEIYMPKFTCADCGKDTYHVSYERYKEWQASDLVDALRLGVLVCCVCCGLDGWFEQERVQGLICPAKCWPADEGRT